MLKEEWLEKYREGMYERGIEECFLDDVVGAVDLDEYDLSLDDPADAADEELSYWGD